MRRSHIGVVLIDHPASSFDDAVTFWAGVQGVTPKPEQDDDQYVAIGSAGGLGLDVQRLDSGTPRVHLDIETDDVAAEVARVVDLGARFLEQRDGYTILTDPGGLVFCVVPVQNADLFDAHATTRD
ncbi:hypothetical protein NSZ01_18860 [Nocardioides szechwanensis]|uniref:Glyoxalase-like domain-containing protein n=1 Tax=Nocardioides szechwanensis TaxID=1005944 RepID=A0A1H0GZD6_9ACTN|nr:VOC family protein [Nocardioides szechwanensis]GEP34118.1 hypothetical protein NSZ01_18860 [Nocardioides szechwanensis]SDO12144.1 hypothetical protein SAMN05192576_3401 [Nocardioides szechwanensis]